MLNDKTMSTITKIFEKAYSQNRHILYEFEVYSVLEALGLGVPHYAYVRDLNEVDSELLKQFHGSAVVKVVSPDLAHKSKYGGVKKITSLDPLFVRFVLHNMKEEVFSHFSKDKEPRMDGFLIAETVPFTLALGNEILIGVMEDPSFGPILSLSKGGDDAEFFAKYYDPANLLIAPISETEALSLVRGTSIRHKFEQFGMIDACDKIAHALYEIGLLACSFSFTSLKSPQFHIKSMDVNPFVFSETNRFVAVDGYIEFAPVIEMPVEDIQSDNEGLNSFFTPNGIVVAGVSGNMDRYSLARIVVQLLQDMGREDVYCLNPKGGTVVIGGTEHQLYQNLKDIPGTYDLLVYAAPGKNTVAFLEDVPNDKAVILISGIPSDMAYTEFAHAVLTHRKRGIRMIGPNCMGVFMAPQTKVKEAMVQQDRMIELKGVNTLFIGEERLTLRHGKYSNAALFSQSGAMCITLIERTQNLPIFKSIVSFGNKVDVDIPDLMLYFKDNPEIKVMAMYLEGLNMREGRRMFDAARQINKPMIVYKGGRTEAGARAAASHTASMSGSYEVFRAACEQTGIIIADELSDFYHDTKVFSMLSEFVPHSNNVGGVVNAGLDATMGADTLNYLQQAVISEETRNKIQIINTHGLVDTATSFLDVTPMTNDQMFADFVDAILSDEKVDCAFIAIVPHVENLKTTDDCCRAPDALANLVVNVVKKHKKPVVVSINSGNHYQELVKCFEENGLPVYSDIRSAIKALDIFVKWNLTKIRCDL